MKIKIIGVVGSPRTRATTWVVVRECLAAARELKDVETEIIDLCEYRYDGWCTLCRKCVSDPGHLCQGYEDDHNKVLEKLLTGDGFIFGNPVYIGGGTAQMNMFINRCKCIGPQVGNPLRNRPFGVVTVGASRYGGQELALLDLLHSFMALDMIPITPMTHEEPERQVGFYGVAAQQCWPDKDARVVLNLAPGSLENVKQDTDAMATCRTLGLRVAEMTKVINSGFTLVNPANGETRWPAHAITTV